MKRLALSVALGLTALGLTAASPAAWSKPAKPYRVVGNVYYVGSEGLAAYLITGPQGHALIDAGMSPAGAEIVEANIRTLGFRPGDVKILLNSHAHFDHAGGLAKFVKDSGARLYASEGDRWALEHGRHQADNENGQTPFAAVRVNHVVKDGEQVKLGPTVMTASLTPGHTPGCTTWTTSAADGGRTLRVLFFCSTTVAGNRLVGNRAYPQIVADYRATFARLKAMHADVFLPGHPELADLAGKRRRQLAGGPNPFVNPAELHAYLATSEKAFEAEYARQKGRAQ